MGLWGEARGSDSDSGGRSGGRGANDPARMQLALRFNLSEAIAERINCECERHDLLACKMQGHDVCFAAVTRLRTFKGVFKNTLLKRGIIRGILR